MAAGNGSDWCDVGAVEPQVLVEPRLQMHWAVQPVMAFADCALDHLPDDSQSNLGWRDDFDALVGRPRPDGLAAGLRIPDMTLLVFGDNGAFSEGVSLEGRTIDWAVSWLNEAVRARTGGGSKKPISIREYEMPEHPVAEGERFDMTSPPAFAELSRWFANGDRALQELRSRDGGWAEVRCWPHHFDLGTLIELDPPRKSIGAGFSPGDHWYAEPYFYVNPYGLAESPADLPALESGGHWHTDGWVGAILGAAAVLAIAEASRETAVMSFLHGAVSAAKGLLD